MTPRWRHFMPKRWHFAQPGHPIVLVFLAFGWDADSPLRPWPKIGSEWRQGGSQALVWIGCCGVHLCVQIGGWK